MRHHCPYTTLNTPFNHVLPHIYFLVSSHRFLPIDIRLLTLWPPTKTNHRAAHSKNSSSTPCNSESSYEAPPPSAVKLEELSLGVLNKLSPGNLKRATNDFMKEWEKSLGEPAMLVKDKAC